ncbi:C6 transcription factor-like protein [Macrophomina phaseolina]|uniref:C6 transcription factor-like protein n=1 Tax=Macrophomina phaseolina TaxID=35725 RepID=A0ABQ8GX51_9PEZI|nr:C6 transcription factor-like protein [Macrophomina phaseolina]
MASSASQPSRDGQQHPSPSSPPDAPAHHRQPAQSQRARPAHDDGDSDQARDSDADHDQADADLDGDEHDASSRKRKRPMSVSCELCKQRKVKCDRGQPSCGWCVRNNQICEYKERKKPGLRAGYGRELEARLDRLEDMIQRQQHTIQQLASSHTNHASPASAHSQHDAPLFHHTPPVVHTPHVPKPEAALFLQKPSPFPPSQPGLSFSNGLGLPSTPAIHHASNAYPPHLGHGVRSHSISSMPSATASMYSSHNPPLESPSLNISMNHQPQPAISSQEPDFPPYDLLYALADLYFKHINTWCPILHRRSTLDSLFGSSTLEEADRILLHAIVATTLRFSTDPRLTKESRERYHATSKQKVLLYGLENSSVKALQALVILALDLVGFSNGPPGWNLLALITRSVVQLGLSVEATSSLVSPNVPSIYTLRAMVLPEPRDFIEDESRRRLFWMVYMLDRYATIATAFEFALDEKETDRKLPCRDDFFARNQPVETRWFRTPKRTDYSLNKPENLGSFSYYVELLGILSQIHQFLKKPVDIGSLTDVEQWQREFRELDNALASWKYSLPSDFGNMSRIYGTGKGDSMVDCGWIMLHAAFHTTVIRLHSSAAYPTTRSPIFTPSYTAIQRCLTAVEAITGLCEYVKTNGMLSQLGTPFAFSLWVAARVLLVHGSTIEHHVDPAINPLVETLRELGTYWRVAERYATLLQRVLDEYRASQHGPADVNGERATPSTVKILADMRRCAFDLDFLISRQPKLVGTGNGTQQQGGVQAQQGGGPQSGRFSVSATPARTPAPNELEYLDVFDFFNMPRLPVTGVGAAGSGAVDANGGAGGELGGGQQQQQQGGMQQGGVEMGDGFNITNFMVDASADWFAMKGAS